MTRDLPPTSSLERLLKVSGLVGRVGTSMAAARLVDLVRSGPLAQVRKTETLVRNATRVVETFGELKGGAMKIGQMLSLHADLLPPEAGEVLRALQKDTRPVPGEVMEYEVRGALGDRFDELFDRFDRDSFAAASIGQVHRGRLRDGREVAVKVQYPMIREIIESDLKNLRILFRALFAMVSEIDFEPFWREIRDHLREELDYLHEAENQVRLAGQYADDPSIRIPSVVPEASTDRVLTMEYVTGLSADAACSDDQPRELRDLWARRLFEFQMRGLFDTRDLHADPNIGNFAFLPEGGIVVYDFGCVKRVPDDIAEGYAQLIRAALEDRREEVPTILLDLGVHKTDGSPLPRPVTDSYYDLLIDILRDEPPYTFGSDPELYQRIFDLGLANIGEATDLVAPEHIIFIDRTLAGHFGNLTRFGATAPWRQITAGYVRRDRNSR